MAAPGTNVTEFAGLAFNAFSVTQAALAAPNTVAHGLSTTPTHVVVVPLDGTAAITAVSVTATNVLFTSTTTGLVTILCF